MHGKLRAILEHKGNEVHSVAPDQTVSAAVEAMNTARVGALLVKNGEQPIGIITERDILCRVVAAHRGPGETLVSDVMTRELAVVKPNLDIEDAMAVVTQKHVRHLPVVEDGRVVGMISSGDLTRWAVRDREVHIQQLVGFITGKYPA